MTFPVQTSYQIQITQGPGVNPIITFSDDDAVQAWHLLFSAMVEHQAAISALQDGPTKADPNTIRTFFLALMVEAGETLNELNWKPWKKKKEEVRIAATLEEAADMMAFFLQCMHLVALATGTTPREIIDAYIKKSQINVRRLSGLVEDYGGDSNGRNV